jgi:Zn-dependent peptidase ImmA (M78 family)/DNA-binding XRE family transcriptional regulator
MDQSVLDTIDPRVLGDDLQKARKRRGLTQEDAAKIIETARTTLANIESGSRRIKPGELIKLAHAYGRQVSDFVRPHPVMDAFPRPQFRGPAVRSEEDEEKIAPYVADLERYCQDYLELEELVEAPLVRRYPPEPDIAGLRTEQTAEGVAIKERNRLGLGDGPLPILRDVLEQDVGLRIFYLPLHPSTFSEMYIYTDQVGGCIAVNSQHPEARRRWSLAHGYCHFLVHRYQSDACFEESYRRLPESERFAEAFARYFLMPTSSLARRFDELRRIKEKTSLTDLGTLAHYYGVSMPALTLRLEDMSLLPTGTWNRLREHGLKVEELQRRLNLGKIPAQTSQFPRRYQYLAFEALKKGLISEERFAHLLNVDLSEANWIAQEIHDQLADGTEQSTIGDDPGRVVES